MNWLKKLKKSLDAKANANRERMLLNQHKLKSLAHQCMECQHFTYRTEKPRNWVCRCPDDTLKFIGSTCLGWKYGTHPEMVVFNSR